MLKDRYMRLILIPLLGLVIPYIAGIITYSSYSLLSLILIHTYFVCTSLLIWLGCSWVHLTLRPQTMKQDNPLKGMFIVLGASGIYGICIAGFMVFLWYQVSAETLNWNGVWIFIGCSVLAVIIFALMYEIIFLGAEKNKNSSLVLQMDKELTQAEMQSLKQETDHHFIFNSLNAMHHLITEDPKQASAFNSNLSQVYKYFLVNKNKDLITLPREMEFMQSYFFLLRIRFGEMIRLCNNVAGDIQDLMIPPCALQVLIENAIKHNEFSASRPLQIMLEKSGDYIKVSNNLHPKTYPGQSTNIGLKNLNLRFRLTCKKEIIIENTPDVYTVKLPLIEQPKTHSHD